jgi:5,6-dimethylbenzimidazole synthase
MTQPYSESERAAVYRVIAERRDMRHFTGGSVPPELLARLLGAAHQGPSVGLMQPWRFIRITDPALRGRIQALVEEERVRTAQAMGERSDQFMQLKVEGIGDCAEVLVAALMGDRERHIFGRRTLPEMDLASLSCAIQNLWLAARAEGLGMGVAVRPAGPGLRPEHAGRCQARGSPVPGACGTFLRGAHART